MNPYPDWALRTALAGAILLAACLVAALAHAATDAEKCESKQLKLSGIYASCRLKADGKARLKGESADYTKCTENLAKKFDKAEEKAGAGVCPTENAESAVASILDDATTDAAERLAAPDPGCPAGYRDRSHQQVIQDWLAAASAQNVPLYLCNYHPAASILDDQGILVGHADIAAAATSLWDLFNGVSPTVNGLTIYQDSVRLLTHLDAGWIEIKDGVDTFYIRDGQIQWQTRHGLITFNGPPPG